MNLEVDFVRLCSLRGMLKLEKVGLKTRGGALRPRIAKEFGLLPRASYDQFLEVVQLHIDAVHIIPTLEPEYIAGWHAMFDQINLDCLKDGEPVLLMSPENYQYYCDQMECMEENDEPIPSARAYAIAKLLCYGETK